MDKAQIIIKCPKCSQKALFKSEWNKDRYVMRPELEGKVVCTNCGYTGSKIFSNEDYYYQIEIKNRMLYARTLENLIGIKNYFQDGKKCDDELKLDFPKVFYENKEEIITKINFILKEYNSGC